MLSNYTNEKIAILYGSQTGNSEDLSDRIRRDLKRFHFKTCISSMNDYNITQLTSERCAIFVCSTTGQGEVPDNMKQFWKFLLRKNLPSDSLCNLRYAVLGLGDSSYTKFNFAAKRLHKRIEQLGAKPLQPLGLGDDQHDLGYDGAADPWINSLCRKLSTLYPLPAGVPPLEALPYVPKFKVTTSQIEYKRESLYSNRDDFSTTVIENKRTTDISHFQDVRLIKLRSGGQEYGPGDVVVLRPKNLSWQVDLFRKLLPFECEDNLFLNVSENDPEVPLPSELASQVSFRQLCEEYFDLMSIPRRRTFEILSHLTDSELEKDKCIEFNTSQGLDDLYTYCNRPRRNIVEVLQDFPNATKNVDLATLFDLIPPIKPREFSIASSHKSTKDEVHILVAVVKYKTKLVKERFGLCSNYLAQLEVGDEISASLKRGTFKFPPLNPVIMVAPGTGVAPFRNLIHEYVAKDVATSDNMVLFFGCRYPDKDFHCKDEFLSLQGQGKVTVIPAFSRSGGSKVYVQDKIEENGDLVWKLLNRGAGIYVAGSAKFMPQEVRKAFVSVCRKRGDLTDEGAEEFVQGLERDGRYQIECW